MAKQNGFSTFCFIVLISFLLLAVPTSVQSIGVCYGRNGDNLPQPSDVINLYKSNNIDSMRIYSPDQDALQALAGSNIQLIVDVPSDEVQSIASDPSAANDWVQTNILAWPTVSFKYIAVGNEVTGDSTQYILPAMQNINNAISSAGLQDQIKVSTAVKFSVIGVSYPPSSGAFSPDAQYMNSVVQLLASTGAPLLLNVYPYFGYIGDQADISLDYALFNAAGTIVSDDNGQHNYQNLFDAMVDAAYAAMEKVGGGDVKIVVSESGWPSAGDNDAASIGNSQTYNQNLINHVNQGTPRRPGTAIETYIFALFNEDRKSSVTEQNFGLFYPNMQPVYQINFS